MRPIKFRAWDSVQKRFGYIDIAPYGIGWPDAEWMKFKGSEHGTSISDVSSIEQFTGLLDKNGKEIYEGDLVDVDFSENGPYQIRWNEKLIRYDGVNGEGWSWDLYLGRNCVLSVIGNVHENPELLK